MQADSDAREQLVVIDGQGVARPVGAGARERMAWLEDATMALSRTPSDVLVLRRVDQGRAEADGSCMVGEIGTASKLHDLCAMLAQSRWRGELTITTAEGRRTILLNDGNVVGAWSTHPAERLGAVLVHFGEMTQHQVDATSRTVGKGVRFGDAAVGLGYLTRETLFRSLHRQTEIIVYAALASQMGTFSFRQDFDERSIAYPLSTPLHSLMLEAVRRMDEMQVFRAQIPSNAHIPTRVAERPLPAEHPARKIYDAIDGTRSVDAIAAAAGEDTFEVVRQLYELLRGRHISLRSPAAQGIAGVVQIFNQVIALILSEVDKYPGASQDIRDSLASFAASGVVYAPLFRAAGPAADGTLDVAQVVANVNAMPDADNRERQVGELLYEYASFAMFISEPVLRAGARSDATTISTQVAEMLQPLAPDL